MGPGMKQVAEFGDRSMERGNFEGKHGPLTVTNGELAVRKCVTL